MEIDEHGNPYLPPTGSSKDGNAVAFLALWLLPSIAGWAWWPPAGTVWFVVWGVLALFAHVMSEK